MRLSLKKSFQNKRAELGVIISLLIITPIGFCTKFYSGPAAAWVNNSSGGVFYEIFWCLVIYLLVGGINPWKIAFAILGATCALEFLQLWQPPFLSLIRSTFIGRTILGNSFAWSDFPYYVLGSGLGWIWLRILSRKRAASDLSFQDGKRGGAGHRSRSE